MKTRTAALLTSLALVCGVDRVVVRAQRQQPPMRPPLDQPGVTPAEIQRMFEAVALVKAQEQLKLSDERYVPFLAKYKALQDVRRRTQQERVRIMRELNRLLNSGSTDEAAIRERLRALQDLDTRSEAEVHKAYGAIDQVLDVYQQARFRLFEEQMEREKINLLTRARQANRPLR